MIVGFEAPSRRRFIQRASLVAAGISLKPNTVLAEVSSDIVETTAGRVRGVTIDGIHWFRGIPYGADTSGRNRFMPPTKVASWSGVRDCTNWGHIAPQRVTPNRPGDYGTYVGWNDYRGGMSEDCLVVNVWTPAVRDHGKRPVMFVIHGGGYTTGSGNLEALEGQHLARLANMVVVTVNHRLGMLGFCDLSAFGTGLERCGNVGLMDLVLALEWVRDNIAQFGGDPGSVTITGQSGGGGKCSHLMAMPSAKGLFHKVAIQSGSALKTGRHDERQKDAESVCAKLGVQEGDLAKLQSIPCQQIIDAQGNAGPVLDGIVVPRDPFDPDAPAISAAIPMIIGTCLEDWAFAMPADTPNDEPSLRKWLQDQLRSSHAEAKADQVLAAYRKAYPTENPFLLRAIIATDRSMRRNAIVQAERKAAQGAAPAYIYRWDWPADGIGAHWGAVHGTDLSPAFANPSTAMTGNTPQGKLLARQLGSSFAAFAKSGNPNNPTIPTWSPYNTSDRPVMLFGAETHQVNDPAGDIRRLWDELLPA